MGQNGTKWDKMGQNGTKWDLNWRDHADMTSRYLQIFWKFYKMGLLICMIWLKSEFLQRIVWQTRNPNDWRQTADLNWKKAWIKLFIMVGFACHNFFLQRSSLNWLLHFFPSFIFNLESLHTLQFAHLSTASMIFRG